MRTRGSRRACAAAATAGPQPGGSEDLGFGASGDVDVTDPRLFSGDSVADRSDSAGMNDFNSSGEYDPALDQHGSSAAAAAAEQSTHDSRIQGKGRKDGLETGKQEATDEEVAVGFQNFLEGVADGGINLDDFDIADEDLQALRASSAARREVCHLTVQCSRVDSYCVTYLGGMRFQCSQRKRGPSVAAFNIPGWVHDYEGGVAT